MAHLEINTADDRRVEIEIAKPEVIIGRDDACDVILDDALTSRRHARLYRDEAGRYCLQDLHSKNGTLVNEKVIATTRLLNGDQIGIGTCRLVFMVDDAPAVVLSDALPEATLASTSAWRGDQGFDLPRQRLAKLYELNERLTGRFDLGDLLGEVLDICVESLRFERAGVAVRSGRGQQLQWIKLKGPSGDETSEFRISRSLVDRALNNGERILINDTQDVDPTASMISNNIRSAMCVPMEYHQEVRGVVYGDRVTSTGGYTREDIDFFAALGRLGAMGLANVQLVEEIRQRQQADLQLQWGRRIQGHLFPAEPLTETGLIIDALNDPGMKISGDYYDFFRRDDGLIMLVMADVSGKGVPASLLMANLQAAVHVTMSVESDLIRAVDRLNKLVCRNIAESRFITAIFGLLDADARTFTYINAGHPGPYVLQADGRVEKHDSTSGLPLGIEPDVEYASVRLDLSEPGVGLFLYTDGIPEAENEQGALLGEEKLAELLRSNAQQPPKELITRLRRSIRQFARSQPQSDDITMLALRLD